ncbi:MAG: YggS family pyridoxal phosphate-dependent enzyme [Polyangiales bacterium]
MSTELERRVAVGLAAVCARIDEACVRVRRPAGSVRLLAVSKGQGVDAIRAAHALGQRDFGESYVQELESKARELADLADIRFRFIGRLQRNKAKHVVAIGCAVDCVDSLALATTLSERAAARSSRLEVMIQVNIDREPQKAGAMPETLPELCAAVQALPALSLAGLMAIPRAQEDPEQARPAFRELRRLGEQLGLRELSMGMSSDLEAAVEEGATMVRVGTAIFGPRA